MAVTWTPLPPVAGDEVTVSATVAGVGGNQVACASAELTLTAVPAGSALDTGLVVDAASGAPTLVFTADVPGEYEYSVQRFIEYVQAPGFDGGAETHTVALDTETGTIYVGSTLTLPIVTPVGSLTLTITTGEDDVLSATLGSATTQKAEWAALDATVVTKLAALVGQSVATMGPALPAKVGAMGVAVDAHFRNSTAHPTGGGYAADSINAYGESAPYDIAEAVQKLNKVRTMFGRHALGSTTSTIHWHLVDDTKNVPLVGPATTVAEAVVLYADMFRCHEGHRVQTATPGVHPFADATNTLGSIDTLSDLIKAVLTFLADETPTVPAAENQAQVEAVSLYGFQEA
jgi:hypothetical protein